jgi:hypothetical protein
MLNSCNTGLSTIGMDIVIPWPHSDKLALNSEIRSSQKTLRQKEIGVWLIDICYKASSVHFVF